MTLPVRIAGVTITLFVFALAWVGPASGFDLVLDHASFRHGSETAPPSAAFSGWQPIELPDRWDDSRPDAAGSGWYRLGFELDTIPNRPLAVYLDHVSMNAAVWLNGNFIGQEGRMIPPVAQNWNRPLYFPIPAALLRAGANELEIQLYRLPHCQGVLAPVRIGDAETLRAMHASEGFWRNDVARVSTVLCAVFAAVMFAFWIASRDPAYGTFAVVCIAVAISNLNFHVRDIPFSSAHWEALVCHAGLLAAGAFWLFARRLSGRDARSGEWALVAFAAAGLPLHFVEHAYFHPLFNLLSVVAVGLSLHAAYLVADHARHEDWITALLYSIVAAATLAILSRELALQIGWLPLPAHHLHPWVGPLLVLGFGAGLTRRFLRAFQHAEAQREQLARAVDEQGAELEDRVSELSVLERERLFALERERIMREMHDGMGGHLVRTLSMLEGGGASRPELADALREALADMRLVIDSLDPSADDLPTRLGMLRSRLERLLAGQSVELVWRIDALPSIPDFGAEASLHVLRIVQEAVTNVIRHASATQLTLSTRVQDRKDGAKGVAVELCDDGIGLDAQDPVGRGMANMRRRAELLGASIEFHSRAPTPGTCVLLWIPTGEA